MVLKRNVLALAIASAGLCFTVGIHAQTASSASTGSASAQQGTQDQSTTSSNGTSKAQTQKAQLAKSLDAITVTGFSNSVEKSIDYQRYSDAMTNVVTAADIGGLPDQSIADALTRLPGVAAERIAGQASQINCRGLSGNFIETTLDGREQPSTSGSNYIQFDQYPSELINMATVYKTSQANLIEGGVGCTIAMDTANPLEAQKEQNLFVDARGSYDGQAHDVTGANAQGYRFSAAYEGKFLDDTLGVGLGFAREYQPHVSEQYVGEYYDGVTVNGQQAYVPDGIQVQQNGGEEMRTGYLGTVVWKPSDHLQLTADAYDSKFDNGSYGYGFRSQHLNSGTLTDPVYGPDDAITGGTVTSDGSNNYSNETTFDDYTTKTNIFSGGLNLKWNDGPWHVDADASMSHSESNEINVDATADPYNGLGTSNPTLMNQSTTYLLQGTNVGQLSFANPGMYTNLNDMAVSRYGVWPYVYHEKNKAFRLNVQYDLDNNPLFSDLQAGVYANNHSYDAQRSMWQYGGEFGQNLEEPGELPLTLNSSDTSVVCFQGSFAGFPCFLKINGPAVLAANGLTPNPQTQWGPYENNSWDEIQSGSVMLHERDAFFQADIDTTLFDHQVTGNIGMRMAHTDQTSYGLQQVSYTGSSSPDGGTTTGSGVPITDGLGVSNNDFDHLALGKDYTDFLPSMNLIYHWDDNDQTRFAVSKDLSRPPIDAELAGSGSWVSGNYYNVWGSTSAYLDPMVAWSYDLNYEHYFDNSSGLFTAGVFFKSIKSFVMPITYNNFDFSSIGIAVPTNPTTGQPYLDGEYQTAYNAQGGKVDGAEISFSKTHFLPGFWSGFGVSANYAYTRSNVESPSTLSGLPQNQTLPGLSRKVASGAIFFDNGTFSSNLTVNYRSKFVSDTQIAVTNQYVFFAPETVWDFQSAYNVTKNLSVLFQILNLSNAPTRTYFGNPSETGTVQYFGRTLYAGVNFKL